jgi:hypothetical protein
LTLSSSIKTYRSETYKSLADADEQGLFSPIREPESGYQGESRGGNAGLDFIGFKHGCCE